MSDERKRHGAQPDVPEVTVVVPAYNEVQSIRRTVDEITATLTRSEIRHEIIVVDDGSTDGTGAAVEGSDTVRLIAHEANRGYGAALKTGIQNARAETVVITDADGTYPIDQIPTLVAALNGCDMVVGARCGENAHIPWIRKPAKWCLAKLANYLAETRIPDLNSGLRALRKDVVERFIEILPNGFSFTTTITLALISNNHPIKYLPVDYHVRVGKSKIRPIQDTINFLMLIVRGILYFNPLKVLLPPGVVLLLLGGVKVVRDMVAFDFHIATSSILIIMTGFQVLAIAMLADLIVMRSKLGSRADR